MGTLTEIGSLGPNTGVGSASAESGGITRNIFEIGYAKSCNLVHFGRKMVRNAVHNAFLNTLTMATAFVRVPLEMTPGAITLSFRNRLETWLFELTIA